MLEQVRRILEKYFRDSIARADEGCPMTKLLTLVAAAILTLACVLPGAAAPKSTPGHMMQQRGSVPGHPGASGYAPGHLKRAAHVRSARDFAPGRHVRNHHHWRYVHHRHHRHHAHHRRHREIVTR